METPPVTPAATSIYEEIVALENAATPFVLVVLVDALGSVPQDTGAKMLVTSTGRKVGTIGGGRVEARATALAESMLGDRSPQGSVPTFVNWSLKGDVGMTCGGSVKLYFEPHVGPRWSIAIFGAGHVAQALIPVLLPLPCTISCFDTRAEWISRLPTARNLRAATVPDLAAEVDALPADSYILCLTQGHATDRPVLERSLATRNFPFIGVIGSAAKAAVLRRELIAAGLDPARAQQFSCPVGLDFGTNHPHEIALSIAAQLLTERDRNIKQNIQQAPASAI